MITIPMALYIDYRFDMVRLLEIENKIKIVLFITGW